MIISGQDNLKYGKLYIYNFISPVLRILVFWSYVVYFFCQKLSNRDVKCPFLIYILVPHEEHFLSFLTFLLHESLVSSLDFKTELKDLKYQDWA